MPKANELKCYFGCVVDGPLHRYPKWDYPDTDKFDQWKSILSPATSARGNEYIYNNVRLCYRHFEEKFQLPSHRLTKNAVPTLNIFSLSPTEEQPSTSAVSVAYEERLPATTGIDSLELGHIMAPTLSPTEEQRSTSAVSVAYKERLPVTSGIDSLELRHIMVPTFSGQGSSISTALPNEERPSTTGVDDFSNSTRTVPPRPKRISKPTDKAIVRLNEKLQNLREKCKSQSRKIRVAKKMATSKQFLKYIEKLPDAAQTFMKMQMRWKKKPRGRRYTTEEKIMSLTIMKQSPKAYKLLQKMFVLPSKRCLQKILGAFRMRPGINKEILENLKNVVRRMPEQKKLVNLLFDEVSLSPGLVYNASQNEIIGFEDNGTNKNNNIADHALVFMIKGIKSKTKQPISFTFCQNSTKKSVLKELLVKIIEEINNTGLRIVATICDQCSSNTSTIKDLIKETAEKYAIEQKPMEYKTSFEVNNIKVFPLFDPPHLLKGVRNNLLIKDAKFTQNGVEKWAKWEHLKMLLAVDVGEDEIRLVNKLTERHIDKDKIKKMKVKLAAQVFSQRVSSAMRFLSKHGVLPEECQDTADFLLIFDKLFDSFNGHSYQGDSKIYKCCIKRNSPHFQLWADLLPILESIKFKSIYRRNNIDEIKYESIPSIRNWIHNIKTFKEMWQYLLLNHNVVNLVTRNFNQDPLENFFSSIRSNGVRNVNPDCNQFMNAFKTLIINNLNSPHSADANCEEDYNSCMQSLSHLILTNRHDSEISDFACNVDSLLHVMHEIKMNDSILHAESKKYVTGYVIKKSKSKIFKNCNICLNDLCRSEIDLDSFNYEVDYTKKSLFHPNDNFITLMNDIYYMIVACLRDNPQSKVLIHKIRFFIDCACDFNIITCDRHKCDLVKFICDLSIKLIVHSWCLGVNRLLNGKISSFDRNDLVKLQAFEYCNKRKKS